jgi:hypothetical protein
MSNKYFPDQEITFNDLYFVCYMVERVARLLHQRNWYVVERLGYDGLLHQLSIAETNHCLNPEQVEHDWVEEYHLEQGSVDVTKVDPNYTDKVPSTTQMGKVYARLIQSVNTPDDLPATIMQVYRSPICDSIDNYNSSAYYEPSYVQTRAYINGGF